MAKKGGIQQLQSELQTDEEFEKFLEKEGILVLDVYAAWCGPCTGMVGSLKKVKLEIGGDNLHLAICRADSIERLKRFRNRSEPTWLVCSNGKIVNLLFGCNVPRLISVIIAELKVEEKFKNGDVERTFYDFDELTPEEKEREALILAQEEEIERIEIEQAIEQRKEYIRHVLDEIMNHIVDMGITIFFPHVMKEAYRYLRFMNRKTADIADKMELVCKERKCVKVKPEMLEILHFEIENPLSDEVLDYIYTKEILIFLWKLGETDTRPAEEVLNIFYKTVAQPTPILDENGENSSGTSIPPILDAADITPGEEYVPAPVEKFKDRRISVRPQVLEKKIVEDVVNIFAASGKPKIRVPAVWTPINRTATAAFIYIFFRNHTDHFLPADPIPEPQHLCFVFDAYKRNSILEACSAVFEDILAYGFFNSDDITTCTLLAKSNEKYELLKPNVVDKIIMKIAKKRSDIVKILKSMGPSYVSENTVVGKRDCLRLFPEDYHIEPEDPEDNTGDNEDESKRKKQKKKRKKRVQADSEAGDQSQSGAGEISAQDSEDTLDDISGDEDEMGESNEEDLKNPNPPAPTPNP